jgi:uncharacterized DUF497 family protein
LAERSGKPDLKISAPPRSYNCINQRKHGFSFETAARIFEDPNVVPYPDRVVDEGERWHAIGSAGS